METLPKHSLEPQLEIGKAVLKSMIKMYYKDDAMESVVIPVTFQGKEFEIEVRMGDWLMVTKKN